MKAEGFKFSSPELEELMVSIFVARKISPNYDSLAYDNVAACLKTFKEKYSDVYKKIAHDYSKGELKQWIMYVYQKHKGRYKLPTSKNRVNL